MINFSFLNSQNSDTTPCCFIKTFLLKLLNSIKLLKLSLLLALLVSFAGSTWGQAVGDYGSRNAGPANWNTANNWVICTTAGTWTLASVATSAPTNADNVWIRSGHTIILNSSPSVNNLVIQGNLTNAANRILTVDGDFSMLSGTFTMSNTNNRSLTLNIGGDILIAGGTITETGTGTSSGNIFLNKTGTQTYTKTGGTISNAINFTVNSGSNLDVGTSVIDGSSGSFTLSSGATLTTANSNGIASGLTASGSVQVTGTRTFNTGASYVYNASGDQVTGIGLPATVNNLTISGSGTKTLQSTVSVTGNLSVSGSTFDLGSFTANRSTGGGSLTLDASSTLLIGGTNTFPTNYSTVTLTSGSIVNYDGSNQSVANQTYSNLILSGSGVKTAASTITTTSLDNGGALNDAVTLTMAGNALNYTTIENTGATIRFNGAANGQAISSGTIEYYGATQTVATGTYNSLVLSTAGTKTAAGNITATNLDNGGASSVASILNMAGYTLSATILDNTGGTIRFNGATNGQAISTGTVDYYGTGQTIATGSYSGLILSNSIGTSSANGAITVSGALTTTSGGTFATGYDVTLNGTVACGGSINATAGVVTYSSTATNVLAGTYNDLVIPNNATLCDNITVNGLLTLGTGLNYNGYTINGLPTVTSVSSSTINGTYKVGQVVTVTVQFSEAVTVTGTPQLTLETGTTDRTINYVSGSGTNTLTFNYTIQAGDINADLDYVGTTSLALNGGAIKDATGNVATLTLPTPGTAGSLGANKAIVIDGVAPTLTAVAIASNNANTAYAKTGDVVTLTFTGNEALAAKPTVTIATHAIAAASVTNTGSNNWQAVYTMVTSDATGIVPFTINFTDVASNAGTQVTTTTNASSVTFDKTAPTLTVVTMSSNNANTSLAVSGNTVTLTITSSENLSSLSGTIDGKSATASGSGTSWTLSRLTDGTENAGTMAFSISYSDIAGNAGTTASVTSGTSVTFAVTFYSQASSDPSVLINWKSTGNVFPVDFTTDNQRFIIKSGDEMTTTTTGWSVSGTGSAIQVNSGGTLSCVSGANITGTASFSLASGATLKIGSPDGISTSGATGSIQTSGVRTFNVGASYVYTGVTPQITGNGLPSVVTDLTINNTGGVTQTNTVQQVNGLFSILAGNFACGGNNLNLNGSITCGGTISAVSPSTVTYNNTTAQSIIAGTYFNLTKSGAGASTLCGTTTVNGLLNCTNSSFLTVDYDLYLSGGVSISAGANLTTGSSAIAGSINFLNASQSITGGGTFTLDNTLNIGNGLTVTNALSDFILQGSLVGGNTSSKFVNTGTIKDLNSGASIPSIMTTGELDLYSNPNLFIYAGGNGQGMLPIRHYNVQLNNSCDLTGNTEIIGNITKTGIALVLGIPGAYTLKVDGNISISGSSLTLSKPLARAELYGTTNLFNVPAGNVAGSTIAFLASGNQTIPSSIYYQNLEIGGTGVKSLFGATTVKAGVSLLGSVLQLGSFDLTLSSATAIAGSFSATSMIETNSTGKLIRSTTATNESFAGTYPVGSGGYYSPAVISNLPAGASAPRSLAIRAVASQPNTLTNAIKKYWDISTNVTSDVNTSLTLQYDVAELATGADATLLQPYTKTTGNWTLATGASLGANPATSTGNLSLTGNYTVCAPVQPTITGKLTDVCKGGTETYTVSPIFNTYTWTVTGGTPTSTTGNPINITWGTDASAKSITVDVVDASGFTSSSTVSVTFFGQPDNPTSFTSSVSTSCPGSIGVPFVLASVTGATSYVWSVSPAGAAVVNGTTNSVTVDFATSAPHEVTISVTPQNSCPSLTSLSTIVTVAREKIYAKASGDFSTIQWNDKADGSGSFNYTYSNTDASTYTFVIGNGYNVNVSSPISIGGLVVKDDNQATTLDISAEISFTGCSPDTFYVGKNATVNYNTAIKADGTNDNFIMDDGELKILLPTGSGNCLSVFETISVTGGTINYNLAGEQDIIAPFAYNNLTLSGSGSKNLSDAITVKGDLAIANSAVSLIVKDNQADISLSGNWINSGGTYSATGFPDAKVIFNNKTANQTISGTTTFNRLVVDKTSTLYLYLDNTVTSNVFINKELTFSGRGVLNVYNNNITLRPGAKVADNGGSNTTFDNGKMIEIGGTTTSGTLIKELTWSADFATSTLNDYSALFPVGNTGKYAAMEIGSLKVSSFSGTKQISMKTTTFTSALTDIVKRSWTISSDLTGIIRAPFALFYNADELAGSPTNVTKDGTKVNGASNDVSTHTLQIPSTNLLFSGIWGCTGSTTDPRWIYTYNTGGDWDNINTWTTDPAGTIPNHVMPQSIDHVVILANATVTVAANTKQVADLEIKENGTLDLTNTKSHTFGTIKGKGLMRLASINLPSANYDEFITAGYGTIEYYDFTGDLPNSTIVNNKNQYNNLIISGTGNKSLVGAATYNIKGNLTVKGTGGLLIGNASNNSVTINLDGNLWVSDATASISLGAGTTAHNLYIKGDFTNNGTVRFTNYGSANYPTSAFTIAQISSFYTRNVTGEAKLEVHFINGSANQTINCNGITDFYRLEMNKGSDATYLLNVFSTAETNCRFWGLNNQADNPYADNTPQVSQQKYLSLQYGTLVLNSNIKIYSLTEGGNFRINQYAIFNINGANILESTCNGGTGSTAPVIYGKMIVNNGVFDAGRSAGIILRSTGAFEQNGGTVNATQLRPSTTSGQHRGSVTITGGTFNVGQTGETGGNSSLFCIPYPDQMFKMSGGTVNINDCRANNDNYGGALQIGINTSNYEITGGTFNFNITKANNVWFTSTVPFYNINFNNTVGNASIFQLHLLSANPSSSNLSTTLALPLVVLNDLTVNSGTFDAASNDVYVRRHFTSTGVYTTGTNTTYFDSNNQSNQNIIANSNINFSNLTINNSASLGQIMLNGTGVITVTKNLSVLQSTLNDNGKTLIVNGNITNNSIHTGTGNITLTTATKTIQHQIDGNGSGLFGNLVLDDAKALLGANQTIKGTLTLTSGLFTIGAYKLTLYKDVYSTTAFSVTKMIATSGNKSDLGVERIFGTTETSITTNLIPIGCIATANKYLPIKLSYIAGQGGVFGIHPVNAMHPYRDNDNVIGAYWIVNASGFNGLSAFTYTFNNNATAIDNTWMSGRITETDDAWTLQNKLSTGADFQFSGITIPTLSGQFTCGLGTTASPALGYITVFESITSGDWQTFATPYYTTWKKTKGTVVENPAKSLPSSNSKVIINPSHVVTMTASTIPATLTVGSLDIKTGGVLDLGITPSAAHILDFGSLVNVGGTGTLRISSPGATAQFPKGDFGNFLGASGGTVEYYATGTQDFTIPYYTQTGATSTLPTYNHLVITPNGRTITLPNIAQLTVYGNLSMGSSGTALTYDAANNNITVNGNLTVGGTVSFNEQNDQARLITIKGNTTIASGSKLQVINGGADNPATNNNFFAFEGNVTNNGVLDFFVSTARYADAQFNGSADAVVDGSGTQTDFNRLTLNKGAKATTLEVTNAKFKLNASSAGANKALTLNTGTFKLSLPATAPPITLNSGASNGYDFTIPSTAQLWLTNSSKANIDATGTNAGVVLGGKLKVDGSAQLLMATPNVNNYIEYSPTGAPEIEIGESATVNIGSQMRRSPDTDNGSLIYTQSGTSSVTIGSAGVPNNNVWIQKLGASNRGVFEIMSGGQFNFTGGTLTVSKSSASPLPDVLIETTNGTVFKDALLKIGDSGNSSEFITLKSALPLGSLEVISNNTANIKVLPLTLLGNATIDNAAKLLMNDLDLTIGGNLTATGTYTHGSNNTTFNGNLSQSISGTSLDFNTLTIDKTGEAILGSNILSVNTLVLNQGILNDNNNTLTLKGNATNNGVEHKSPGALGRIIFNGSAKQTIDGTGGIWGSIDLSNSNNIAMISSQQINNTISFTSGYLDISGNLLTLGNLFNIAKTPSATSMIRSNGLISDQGIKLLATTGSFNYTLPIGVSSMYTPVTMSGTCTTAGSINCKPVNSIHYATTIGLNKTIDYYWAITTSGFAGTVTHSYNYSACTMYGVETQYVTGRFYSGAWLTATGTVNTTNHTFTFSNTSNLDGEYTVGEIDKFVLIADDFYSVQDGDWSVPSTWDQNTLPKRTSNIHVRHNVGITTDQRQCINLELQSTGVLTLNNPTWGHSFAKVTGTGKMVLAKVKFPGGSFSSFVATGGGTLEYTNGTYNIENNAISFNNVIFNSNGILTMPEQSFTVYGNFEIKSGTTVTASSANFSTTLKGDYTNDGTYNGSGKSIFSFEGATDQTISGVGDNNFNNVLINKPSGKLLTNSDIVINGNATFTKGIVQMGTGNKTILTTSGAWTGASANSFVSGSVQKQNNGASFTFPVGKETLYRPITASGYSGAFTVEYFNTTYNQLAVADNVPPIQISPFEYWNISRAGTESADFTYTWNYDQMPASDLTKLRMAYYDLGDSKWHVFPSSDITLSPTATIASGSLTLKTPAPYGRIALSTIEPPHLHCPAVVVSYTASTAPATGITYEWTLSSAIADLALSNGNRTATLTFHGNLEHDAELSLTVKNNGVIISRKVYWLTTFPQNINPYWPSAFCAGASLVLNAPQDIDVSHSDFANYEWKKDGTTLAGTTKQLTVTSITSGTYQLRVYKTVSGIDGGCWSNPYSKLIKVDVVTPGGIYRYPNK